MDSQARRGYTQEEVITIIRRALRMHGPDDVVNAEELEEIARQSGISPERLRRALEEEAAERALDEAKEQVRAHNRKEFGEHFRIYLIVNAGLVLFNLFTPGYFWVLWVILGWGIGLAIHASEVFFVNEAEVEKKARKWLQREQQKAAWQEKFAWITNGDWLDFRSERKRGHD